MARDYQTENESLRARNAALMAEIRERDMAEVRARIEATERANAEAAERDRAAQQQATAAELEARRRSAWLLYRTDEARALGHEAFIKLLSKKDMLDDVPDGKWPPGYEAPEQVAAPHVPPDSAAGTLVGQLLAKKGITI